MTFLELKDLLKSNNVYNDIKNNEKEIFILIPELSVCKGFNQNNSWHIYDVYEHILHVIAETDDDICLRIAALFHDIGKPLSYVEDNNGVGHFYGHWDRSIEIFTKYQNNFKLCESQIDLIKNLIFYHDKNIIKMSDEELNIMLEKIGFNNIDLLFDLKRADLLSQNPKYHYFLSSIAEQQKIVYQFIKK